jgi:hypothetical protein
MIDLETRSQFERTVLTRLDSLGRRLRLYLLMDGLAVVSVAVAAAIFITLLMDYTFWLGRDMRAVQLLSLLATLGVVAWRFVGQPLQIPLTNNELAVIIERRFPQLQSRLITAVEFATAQSKGIDRSAAMIESVVRQARMDVARLSFDDVLAHDRFRRARIITAGCALLIVLSFVLPGSKMPLWFQRNVLLSNVDWPQRNLLVIEGLVDGKLITARGDDVTLTATVPEPYHPPRQASISYETDSGVTGGGEMPAIWSEVVTFHYTFERIRDSRNCEVRGGDATPIAFRIEVVDRPRVSHVTLAITPPAYTGLSPYDLRSGQTVAEILVGSEIRFQIETNKPVVEAVLIRQNPAGSARVGQAEGTNRRTFEATDRPESTANYHFELVDELGLTNQSERTGPVRFAIRLVEDKAPSVKMRIKGAGGMITPAAVLPIEMDFTDTYGLASADLVHATSREGIQPIPEPVPGFEAGTKTFAHKLSWSVSAHGFSEGDRLTLHAQGADSDNIAGPNVGQSPPRVFRIVSPQELLAELSRREQEYRQDFERIIRMQEELYADLLTLSRAKDLDTAERQRRFRRLSRRQRDQAGRLNTLKLQFEQVLSELRINQLADAAVEERLDGGVIVPLGRLTREDVAEAAEALGELAQNEQSEGLQAARDSQDRVLAEMRAILNHMLKWERFQEAVMLLREVIKMQDSVNQETEKTIEADILGTKPASDASNP